MMKKIISLLGVIFLFAVVSASAQTPRRTPRPKPLATPPPTLTGAEIISRASELDEPNVQPTPRPTPRNATTSTRLKELNDRVDRLETTKKIDKDESQRRMLLNLDILTRAEQRSEGLRKQLFDLMEKENSLRIRIDQISTEVRPEYIERAVQIAGTLRPEEVRESRRKSLDAEKANLDLLLIQVQSTKANVQVSLDRADQLVEKLRTKLEKEIDDTFLTDPATDEKPEKPDELN